MFGLVISMWEVQIYLSSVIREKFKSTHPQLYVESSNLLIPSYTERKKTLINLMK